MNRLIVPALINIYIYKYIENPRIEQTRKLASLAIIGCKHRASEGVFYIGGRGCVLCQFIEPITFARCAFIFGLRNIALGGYLKNILKQIYRKFVPLNTPESSLHSQLICCERVVRPKQGWYHSGFGPPENSIRVKMDMLAELCDLRGSDLGVLYCA